MTKVSFDLASATRERRNSDKLLFDTMFSDSRDEKETSTVDEHSGGQDSGSEKHFFSFSLVDARRGGVQRKNKRSSLLIPWPRRQVWRPVLRSRFDRTTRLSSSSFSSFGVQKRVQSFRIDLNDQTEDFLEKHR